MTNKVITTFEGEVNGVKIYEQTVYKSTVYIFEQIEGRFGEMDSPEPIECYIELLETLFWQDFFSLGDFEIGIMFTIHEDGELTFSYHGHCSVLFDKFNQALREAYGY